MDTGLGSGGHRPPQQSCPRMGLPSAIGMALGGPPGNLRCGPFLGPGPYQRPQAWTSGVLAVEELLGLKGGSSGLQGPPSLN